MTNTKELIHRLDQMRMLALDEHIGDPVDAEALEKAINLLKVCESYEKAIKMNSIEYAKLNYIQGWNDGSEAQLEAVIGELEEWEEVYGATENREEARSMRFAKKRIRKAMGKRYADHKKTTYAKGVVTALEEWRKNVEDHVTEEELEELLDCEAGQNWLKYMGKCGYAKEIAICRLAMILNAGEGWKGEEEQNGRTT